jgi:NAD dependent epimerase/dehydratase family enzyme
MKLILSGSSGFIGREVLSQALIHPSITQIIALSRKPLESKYTQNPKLKVAIVEDFERYTLEVLEELKGAESCIWFVSLPFAGILIL